TQFLQREARIAGGWKELDAFFQSDASRGSAELIAAERRTMQRRVDQNQPRRPCFVLALATGREQARPPVLYAAGNQGCGFPPALTKEGRPIIFYGTVYPNWNRGVNPAVGLVFHDLASNSIEPIRHASGN